MGKGPTARQCTDELTGDAVALYRSSGRPMKEVGRSQALGRGALGNGRSFTRTRS